MEIGSVLRKSRLNSKMSVEQVSKILTDQGYKASKKTVYSWENGNSRPDIEILMKLCDIYGIKDILKTFGYDGYKEDGSLLLNMKEIDLVEKYRTLDTSGQKRIIYDLEEETKRVEKIRTQQERIEKLEAKLSEKESEAPLLNAAHADNYMEATEELKKQEEDIMDDENF